MREILSRGKRIDNGEWVEGFYSQLIGTQATIHYILTGEVDTGQGNPSPFQKRYRVDPETVGQYTGLKDRWEGDAIIYDNMVYVVTYDEDYFGFVLKRAIHDEDYCEYLTGDEVHSYLSLGKDCGNIHDNPELLEDSK